MFYTMASQIRQSPHILQHDSSPLHLCGNIVRTPTFRWEERLVRPEHHVTKETLTGQRIMLKPFREAATKVVCAATIKTVRGHRLKTKRRLYPFAQIVIQNLLNTATLLSPALQTSRLTCCRAPKVADAGILSS